MNNAIDGQRISAHFTDPEYIEARMTQSVHDGIIQRRRPVGKAELISTHTVMSQNPLPGVVTGDCKCGCISSSAVVLLVKTLKVFSLHQILLYLRFFTLRWAARVKSLKMDYFHLLFVSTIFPLNYAMIHLQISHRLHKDTKLNCECKLRKLSFRNFSVKSCFVDNLLDSLMLPCCLKAF